MRKMILLMFVSVTIFVLLFHLLINSIQSEIRKEQNKYEVQIGRKLVLEKDTLTIVDYSSVMENFTLSNGKTVNASFVFSKDSISKNK